MNSEGTSPPPGRSNSALMMEIGLCAFLIAVFCLMFVRSFDWEIEAALFPRIISGLGVLSVLAYLAQLAWKKIKGHDGSTRRILDIPWVTIEGDSKTLKNTAIGVITWALIFWVGIVLVGFHIAAPLYLYSQLVIYGNVKKWMAALSGGVCLLVLDLVYDRLAGTTWNDPVLFDLINRLF